MKNLKEIKEKIMIELNKIQSDEDRCNAILELFTFNEENYLLTECEKIRDDWMKNVSYYLRGGNEWYEDDVEYVTYHNGIFKGVRFLVPGGGPAAIWIDTSTGCVVGGAFGVALVSVFLPLNVVEEINDWFNFRLLASKTIHP